ncbi:1-deoxy-D-xylulose-5-phosphate reductoisomerase [Desulfoluna spongiiphila]|uniref:1-deoxy-D-xylulose-5-phosphate reductoisomerase n=1 Tax=Desulfoluna spongiiphila TaxID=419481 RepID=UPI00125B323B|nr:1-deoxy-D-xylulose-5-phosphate reductoisomerase [Desulfoluna spongiiphila]VVS90504.1 1-deoxy-d-xylulose 5-phosphate reductoisomerase [Desulfoluna spongiiphila]
MKYLTLLGSTGSIGKNVLEIVRMYPDRFGVKALCAATSVDLLAAQILEFSPEIACVIDEVHRDRLKALLPPTCSTELLWGVSGYNQAASHGDVSMVVSAFVGAAGLVPTLSAIEAGKSIALANKETLVTAGDLVMPLAAEKGVPILPVDSEHSAIFQCLNGENPREVNKLILTASGGPFRSTPREAMGEISLAQALNHPTWSMGKKITIDSATLMNKGLEVIEAHHLFAVEAHRIEVVVHPQSIVHSMVAYVDGVVMAQLGQPDMKGAIAYALNYPQRLDIGMEPPDFAALAALTFETPDFSRFRCLKLAFDAAGAGGTMPTALNAANEVAVASFLEERIGFLDIPRIIESTMDAHSVVSRPVLDDVQEADAWARRKATELICP